MDGQIAALLIQDGLVNGAIYALLALALVLVFAVTRIIFLPQGEFVAFGALTLALLQAGKTPGTLWLLVGTSLLLLIRDGFKILRQKNPRPSFRRKALTPLLTQQLLFPTIIAALCLLLAPMNLGAWLHYPLTFLIVVPLGTRIYRLAYEPLADASTLVLLMVSVTVHLTLVGFGLLFFGAEGFRIPPFIEMRLAIGWIDLTGQSVFILLITALVMLALYLFSAHTLYGKSLRATAMNRRGAILVGISVADAGRKCFLLAALIGVTSGILIGPMTTIYYESGFLIALKGFVAAIIGGLVSFPLAVLGALLVGLLESFSSFWASSYKEVIVFTLIIPVLLWRSLRTHTPDEES